MSSQALAECRSARNYARTQRALIGRSGRPSAAGPGPAHSRTQVTRSCRCGGSWPEQPWSAVAPAPRSERAYPRPEDKTGRQRPSNWSATYPATLRPSRE